MERAFFENNRRRLLETILQQEDSVLVLFSGLPHRRTADENYPFYANRSFVYLTGLEQEDLVYLAWRSGGQIHETLFLPPVDAMHLRWRGRMLRPEQATDASGIADTAARGSFSAALHRLLCGMTRPAVYLDFDPPAQGQPPEPAQAFADTVQKDYPWCSLGSCHNALQRLRTIKQPEELAALRRSLRLTDEGIRAMLHACRPGMFEYQLRAVFEKTLADHGARQPAFDTIVAAGENALVMHYPEQDAQIGDGDMILIDLGAQCGLCGADISRVFPANGRFTPQQKRLHDASLSTITYICQHLQAGMSMRDIDRLGHIHLLEKLRAMGLAETLEQVRDYCWHSISHHLGFDTHDDNDYTMPLAPGMVFTMEVGVYVPQWGEGVRIEDNILMTDRGCENLSTFIPRTVEEIEAVMAEKE